MPVVILSSQGRGPSCQSEGAMSSGRVSYVRINRLLTSALRKRHAWVETIVAREDRDCGTQQGKSVS